MNIINIIRIILIFALFLTSPLFSEAKSDSLDSFEKIEDAKTNSNSQVDQKKGYDWVGVPFLKFRSDFGLGGGAKVSLFDYGDGSRKPFVYNLQLQYFATSLGKKDHVLYFIAPDFLKQGIDIDVELRYQFLDNSKYFGVGNNTIYDKNLETKSKADYISDRYYDYKRVKPRFVVNVMKQITPRFKVLLGYGAQKTTIKRHDKNGVLKPSLLYNESPFGLNGGYTNFVKVGVVYDSRNSIASPYKGFWSEFAIEFARKFLKSDYDYNRYTFTDRRYFRLFDRLVFAQRFIYEWMTGDVPFYEYSFIGGSATLTEALGGDKALRGYIQNRFIDNSKFITNSELRYQVATKYYKTERFDVYTVGFWDMGRVYSGPDEFTLKYLNYTYGGGLRIAWNKYFVGRFDLGFSEEGYGVNIGFANIF